MKVSIIVPVYNAAPHLKRCLDSIGRQTFRDFEVVAVDDGSTDGSGRMLDEYAASFPLKRIHQANGGASKARNTGFAAATGEFVVFFDADDVVHPRLLEWTLGALDSAGADYAVFDHLQVPEAELLTACAGWTEDFACPVGVPLPVPAFSWFVDCRRLPAPWQFICRRADLPPAPFPEDIAIYEDVPFALGLVARPLRGVWLKKALYGYAVMEKSQSHHSPIGKRMTGIEAGMRLMRTKLDDVQWRLHAQKNCAHWVMDLWREIHALPEGPERNRQCRELYAFVGRLRADGLIQWRDFSFRRRLRLIAKLLVGRKVASLLHGEKRIKLAPQTTCSGCSACAAVCPFGAIRMVRGSEGFAYPEIDEAKCRSCGKCQKACPSITNGRARTPRLVLAACSKDDNLRSRAASGGLFPVMAQHVIGAGGIVYGAAYDEKWTVRHRGVDKLEDLPALSRSKYMESRIDGLYEDVLNQLKSGRRVLFSGTPCQVAGLLRTVGNDWPNLVAVEVFCGGAPSPLVWQTYLLHCQKVDGHVGIVSVDFRDKSRGWEHPHLTIRYADGASRSKFLLEDSYQLAFFSSLSTREGCHHCQVQSFRSGADISIGDFWGEGIVERYAALTPEKGLSAVVLHTDRGISFFGEIKDELQTEPSSCEALRGQYDVLYKCRPAHRDRKEFFRRVQTEDFDRLVSELMASRKRRKKKGA